LIVRFSERPEWSPNNGTLRKSFLRQSLVKNEAVQARAAPGYSQQAPGKNSGEFFVDTAHARKKRGGFRREIRLST
jgi:hypothetical protein